MRCTIHNGAPQLRLHQTPLALWGAVQYGYRPGSNALGCRLGIREHCGQRVSPNCSGLCPLWHHQHVLVLCDNMAVVQVLAAQSSRDHTLMHLLRCIHFFCAANDFKLRAKHIPGQAKTLADAISRNHLQVFFSEAPQAQSQPSHISEQL